MLIVFGAFSATSNQNAAEQNSAISAPVYAAAEMAKSRPLIAGNRLLTVIPAQAGIQTRPTVRTGDNAGFGGNAELPDALSPENAAAGAATLDSRLRGNDEILSGNDGILNTTLRGNDKIPVIPAQAGISGSEGLAFGDYVRREQVRLLFALDNALSQKAEDALRQELPAVKKAQVQLQSKLGGRKGNIGINLIGALDESDSRAIGWQFRGYAGQQSSKGMNAGLFYRTISNGILHGVNAFADYEDGDNGAFFRYGIGGEVRHSLVAFSANYYLPVTDERKVNSTVAAFSRKGYDAKLRLNAPDIERLRVAMDYYHFGGKRGTKKDSGFRYGVEVDILPALRLGVYHDSESEKFGGDIAYSHTFNSHSPSFLRRQESITEFTPDLFAPVSREYGQRIAAATTKVTTGIVITPIMTITNAMTVAAMTTTTTTTITTPTLTATRMASVLFTARFEGVFALPHEFAVATTRPGYEILVTLPPASASRPFVLTLTRDVRSEFVAIGLENAPFARVVSSNVSPAGSPFNFDGVSPSGPLTITIAEGSEQFVSVMTTLTTESTMTMAAISTTTRITAFVTTTVTTIANAAINTGGENGKTPHAPPPSNPPKMALSDIPPSRHFAAKDKFRPNL